MTWLYVACGFVAGAALGTIVGFLWGRHGKTAAVVQAATKDEAVADSDFVAQVKATDDAAAALAAEISKQSPEQVMEELEKLP